MSDQADSNPAAGPRVVDPAVPALEQRLGVALPDAALALAALTHKSYVNEHRGEALSDNERLEFLGDAVIDLAVSHRLMERFPEAREGELSKIRAAVVDEPGLARIARELDLGPLLRLGRGEELTGGRQKSSLLADALEAVIAVVYVTGGLAPVLGLVDRFLDEAFARAAEGTLDRDYKTQLQELAQSRLRATPRYRVIAERGPDHSKTFDVELELRGEIVGRGEGRSKKDAEQAAAKIALTAVRGETTAQERRVDGAPAPASEPEPRAEPVPEAEPVQPAPAEVAPPVPGDVAPAAAAPRDATVAVEGTAPDLTAPPDPTAAPEVIAGAVAIESGDAAGGSTERAPAPRRRAVKKRATDGRRAKPAAGKAPAKKRSPSKRASARKPARRDRGE